MCGGESFIGRVWARLGYCGVEVRGRCIHGNNYWQCLCPIIDVFTASEWPKRFGWLGCIQAWQEFLPFRHFTGNFFSWKIGLDWRSARLS